MSVNYAITIPNELSKDFFDYLTGNYDCKIDKIQHSIDGDTLNVDVIVVNTK